MRALRVELFFSGFFSAQIPSAASALKISLCYIEVNELRANVFLIITLQTSALKLRPKKFPLTVARFCCRVVVTDPIDCHTNPQIPRLSHTPLLLAASQNEFLFPAFVYSPGCNHP